MIVFCLYALQRRGRGIARPQSQLPHSCVCVSDLYIPRIGPHIFLQQNMQTDPRSWDIYINRTQTHECGNWDCDCSIPFLGIFVSNFRYFVFAVCAPEVYFLKKFRGYFIVCCCNTVYCKLYCTYS
jgi:hypothetical protein